LHEKKNNNNNIYNNNSGNKTATSHCRKVQRSVLPVRRLGIMLEKGITVDAVDHSR